MPPLLLTIDVQLTIGTPLTSKQGCTDTYVTLCKTLMNNNFLYSDSLYFDQATYNPLQCRHTLTSRTSHSHTLNKSDVGFYSFAEGSFYH